MPETVFTPTEPLLAGGAAAASVIASPASQAEAAHPAPPPRILGRADGPADGPTIILLGALHGNEPAGVIAIQRVLRALQGRELAGNVVGLVGNRAALARGVRYVFDDLNRFWTESRLERIRIADAELDAEEAEVAELSDTLDRILEKARGDVYLLDIHSTSGPSPTFVVLEDRLRNRAFALAQPVPIVLGLEEELEGTFAHWISSRGVCTAGFECGSHADPESPARAEAAIWIAMERAGILTGDRPEVGEAVERLDRDHAHLPHVVELRYRHSISASDQFKMHPGFRSFQKVRKGQPLASDRHGEVTAPMDGYLLMPLYQAQGQDGFFLVRRVRSTWLKVSAVMRHLRLERWLHWLPGVRPHPTDRRRFLVDTRVARWAALEIFHLLGFRREGPVGRVLTLVRRYDG